MVASRDGKFVDQQEQFGVSSTSLERRSGQKKRRRETKKEEEKEEDKNNRSATVRRNASRSYIDVNSAEWREAAAKKKRRMEIEKKEGEEKAKKKNVKAVVVATRIGVAPSAQQKHGGKDQAGDLFVGILALLY